MKKVIATLLASFLMFAPCLTVYADDTDVSIIEDTGFSIIEEGTGDGLTLFKESYCEKSPSGSHEAFSRGWGTLYRGSASGSNTLVFSNGATWLCPYCYQAILTQNDNVPDGISIGYYAMYNPLEPLSIYKTVLYSNNVYYTTSSKLAGYNFRYRS